jgi:hypothetical protein
MGPGRSTGASLDLRLITSPSEDRDGEELAYCLYSREESSILPHENGSNVSESKFDGRDDFTGTYNQETINR